MTYSKHRYKSRHEKYLQVKRNTKMVLIFCCIAAAILIYKNRRGIWDYVRFYF